MKNIRGTSPIISTSLGKLGRLLLLAIYKPLYYWLAICGFITVVLIAGYVLVPDLMLHQVRLLTKQQIPPSPTIGNMNGVKLSIPHGYRQFPIEYEGESVWDTKEEHPVRTFESRINNFSVHVQWPTLEPRSQKNEASFLNSTNTLDAHDWLVIGINAWPLNAPYYQTLQANNGLARLLVGHLNHPERYSAPPSVHYELKGLDSVTGLQMGVPVGSGSEKRELWNNALYWVGDKDQFVTTYIECPHGAFSNPAVVGACRHRFEIQELKADVSVTYRANLLPQWKEIQAKTQQLIMSFKVSN